jgi:TRAP-type C4-dicarboxylate transport system permease small subunit
MRKSRLAPSVGAGLRRAVDASARFMAHVAVACIVIMLFATIADVMRRGLTGSPIRGVVELSEVAMVAIVYLSLGLAESRRAHVSVTLLIDRLSARSAAIVNGIGLLIVIAVVAWMVVVTGERAEASIAVQEYRFGLVRIPVWPARLMIVLGLLVYLFALIFRLVDTVRVILPGDRRPEVPSLSDSQHGDGASSLKASR